MTKEIKREDTGYSDSIQQTIYMHGHKDGVKAEHNRHQTILDKLAERMADESHSLEYGCDCKHAVKAERARCAEIVRNRPSTDFITDKKQEEIANAIETHE